MPRQTDNVPYVTRRSRRTGSQDWDCNQDAVVQPIAPTVSIAPATTSGTRRCSTSISGRKASEPKKAPGSSARTQITAVIPRRQRRKPGGISRGSASSKPASPRTEQRQRAEVEALPGQLDRRRGQCDHPGGPQRGRLGSVGSLRAAG